MKKIGVDPKGIQIMQPKGISYALKIKGISSAAANILKQEMLSRGGEVALPWQALNKPKSFVDILLFGTKNQYQHLINKIKIQPFQLQEVSYAIKNILNNIENPCPKITIGSKTFNLAKKVLLMGILNITPDSFSDGGKYLTPASAVQRAHKLLKDGADIIDLGAESSRPGAKEISAQEELKRLVPVLQTLLKKTKAIISIDTTKALVAKKCLELGVHMINDISGLKSDPQMAKVVAKFNVPIILMHRSGKSKVMQKKTKYQDFISDLIASLNQSIEIAQKAGIKKDKIIIDPGIGFGKSTAQNLEIFKRLSEFKSLGFPILIGASRKSMIGNVLNLPIDQRLEGSLALSALAISNGANILRVHDVKENARVIKMCQAILQTPRT
ncbi:MAG: dihydropteroate synthase [Candidatus Margulisbacteria bacterium]|nr:dihydropteroate synthase [Candidatus Margulisiibacteriota bacterium]